MKEALSILAIVLGTVGTILTLYVIKLIRVDSTAPFSEAASILSREVDPTPAIRRKRLYDPYNKKIMSRFRSGIVLIILGAVLQIIVLLLPYIENFLEKFLD